MPRRRSPAHGGGATRAAAWGGPALPVLVLAIAVAMLGSASRAAATALPGLPAFRGLRRDTAPYKGFSGIRLRDDSARKVFFHDQTIAVVEVDYKSMDLQNCELIEVK